MGILRSTFIRAVVFRRRGGGIYRGRRTNDDKSYARKLFTGTVIKCRHLIFTIVSFFGESK